jgi:hypothetical protein
VIKRIVNYFMMITVVLLLLSTIGGPVYASDYRGPGSPEFLYYIEGTGAYFLPDQEADVFFSLGRWYRRSGTSWSVSAALAGPWGAISVGSVPSVLIGLPPDFRTTLRLGRVPYRYVVGSRSGHDDYGPRYYHGRYYDDHDRRGYRRRWHPSGYFWFFVAPDLDHDDWFDNHRRRGRGRGRGRD